MTQQERYELVDMPFYYRQVAPLLPPSVLDFHTHVWTSDQWLRPSLETRTNSQIPVDPSGQTEMHGQGYMVTPTDYPVEQLLEDVRAMFPDRDYSAVFFGMPTPRADEGVTNDYVARESAKPGLYPLAIVGRDRMPPDILRGRIVESRFFGYKVRLDWIGDDYGDLSVGEMIGPSEMELADELGLIVLLHVPGSRRLADPNVQRGVREYARRYTNARIVLAHCGRCYTPGEMLAAIRSVQDLENVYFDTAMVMEPSVLHVVFDCIGPGRMLFATDLPVANMRGRRTYVMDHWVDIVLDGYPSSAFRVSSNNIQASFMAYEIVLAIDIAARTAGISESALAEVFWGNGMSLLRHVMQGRLLESAESPVRETRG